MRALCTIKGASLMRSSKWVGLLCASLAILAAASSIAGRTTARAAQSSELWFQIDATISPFATSKLAASPTMRAKARADRQGRRVVLTWMHAPSGNFGPGLAALADQEIALRYFPTAVDFANPDRLIVGGRTSAGRVVVEAITLVAPQPLQLADGSTVLALRMPAEVKLVFDQPLSTYGMVEMIGANRGLPGRSFLRFTGVDDLHQLDWSALHPVAPVVALPSSAEPLLSERFYKSLCAGDHQDLGYVYILRPDPPREGQRPLYLIDSDRNGVIDTHAAYSPTQARELGLLEIVGWIEYLGVPPD